MCMTGIRPKKGLAPQATERGFDMLICAPA